MNATATVIVLIVLYVLVSFYVLLKLKHIR
jgi:hypothetical protein